MKFEATKYNKNYSKISNVDSAAKNEWCNHIIRSKNIFLYLILKMNSFY